MKNILKSVMVIVGTLIGAGFASGQEIASFFNRFSSDGIWGIVLSSLLFGITIFGIVNKMNQADLNNYQSLVKNNQILMIIVKIFTFLCFCIMLAGIGTYLKEQYGIDFWIGTICTAIICFCCFLFQFHGLEKINNYLVPMILLGIVMLGFQTTVKIEAPTFDNMIFFQSPFLKNWVQAGMLYFGYNSILLVPILIEMKNYHFTKKEVLMLSILTTLLLSITGLIVYFTLNRFNPNVVHVEMPMLLIANLTNRFNFYYYSVVIIFAIFTTAFSSGYAFLKLNSDKKYFKNCVLMCFFGVAFARVGFSNLINLCFPIFGYFGVIQMIYILMQNKKLLKSKDD